MKKGESIMSEGKRKAIDYYKDDTKAFHWVWVYAHGKLEKENGFDIGSFSEEKPKKSGYYMLNANDKIAVVRLMTSIDDENRLEGRICYLNDTDCIEYLQDDKKWY